MLQEAPLTEFKTRHADISGSEKVGTVRTLFRVASKLNPKWTQAASGAYAYMRILDDMIDESPCLQPVRETLVQERRGILGQDKPTDLQEEFLAKPFADLLGPSEDQARVYMNRILSGMMTDLDVRQFQKPLAEGQLQIRNFRVTYYPFAVLSLGTVKKDMKHTPGAFEMMNDFASYDNVSDIVEDLPNGLVLISREDLQKYGMSFQDGQTLDRVKLEAFYKAKGIEVRKRLSKSSSEVFNLGLPLWFATVLYTYFYTRSLKLCHPMRDLRGPVYKAPLDAA